MKLTFLSQLKEDLEALNQKLITSSIQEHDYQRQLKELQVMSLGKMSSMMQKQHDDFEARMRALKERSSDSSKMELIHLKPFKF